MPLSALSAVLTYCSILYCLYACVFGVLWRGAWKTRGAGSNCSSKAYRVLFPVCAVLAMLALLAQLAPILLYTTDMDDAFNITYVSHVP